MKSADQISTTTLSLEKYFDQFKKNIIGEDARFSSPYGEQKVVYADWTASGRLYEPIEELMKSEIAKFVGNTHTETTFTGCTMTYAYHKAKELIKAHVGASETDVFIPCGSGMTGAVNKLQRILGLRIYEKYEVEISERARPVVFVTHMEHHSNQTSWLETIADVIIINATQEGLPDLNHLETLLKKYKNRAIKIAAITSCSNVTGVFTPYHQIAKMMHQNDGKCFVDFACSAPYIDINMHPADPLEKLDAIYFSPHKFLGGPGTSGVLVFCSTMYQNIVPDNPGGGTVEWTNPWGEHKYINEIELREDGGTPPFLQTIRIALCVKLKNRMGVKQIRAREAELLSQVWKRLDQIPNLHILAHNQRERLPVISFYINDLHYNLGVKLLNDRYGIQVRGGCSCAGTYGHYLLNVTPEYSGKITCKINAGDLSEKPGWIRMSLHPTTTNQELDFILNAIETLAKNHENWAKDYDYNLHTNEFTHKLVHDESMKKVDQWFSRFE